MKAEDFLDKKFNGCGYECKVYDWSNNESYNYNLPDLLEEYAKLYAINIIPTNKEIDDQKCVNRSPANIEEWEGFQQGVKWIINYIGQSI